MNHVLQIPLIIFVGSVILLTTTKGDLLQKLKYFEVLKFDDILIQGKKDLRLPALDSYHFIEFRAFERKFHIKLKKSSIVGNSFKAETIGKGGLKTTHILNHTHFYVGYVSDDPSSSSTVSFEHPGILVHITTKGEEYIIEPAWRHDQSFERNILVAYRKSDIKDNYQLLQNNRNCNARSTSSQTTFTNTKDRTRQASRRRKRSIPLGSGKVCKILLVADHYFYTGIGGGSVPSCLNYMIGLSNRVNEIYKKTAWASDATDLSLELAGIIIHDSSTEGFNAPNRQISMDTLLLEFGRAYYSQTSDYCLMHLLTYQPFGDKLGLAYVASRRLGQWGGICSTPDHGSKTAYNTGVSTFMDPGGNRQLSIVAMSTVAHGHNWGSNHDPDTDECTPSFSSGGKYLMFSRALKATATNNLQFSPCSKRSIYEVLLQKGPTCFAEKDASIGICGNGRIDVGESCDSGGFPDGCCDSVCHLIPGATCSSFNFACCKNCQLANKGTECSRSLDDDSDCKGNAVCDGENYICPDPPPKENSSCIDGGECQNGVCVGVCEQQNLLPCVCEDAGNSCKRCCKSSQSAQCVPSPAGGYVQDGQVCYQGFCRNGACIKSALPIERLWDVVLKQITNSFEIFMKNNIILFVTLFTAILYVPAAIIVCRVDKKNEDIDKNLRDRKIKKKNDIVLESDDYKIQPLVSINLRSGENTEKRTRPEYLENSSYSNVTDNRNVDESRRRLRDIQSYPNDGRQFDHEHLYENVHSRNPFPQNSTWNTATSRIKQRSYSPGNYPNYEVSSQSRRHINEHGRHRAESERNHQSKSSENFYIQPQRGKSRTHSNIAFEDREFGRHDVITTDEKTPIEDKFSPKEIYFYNYAYDTGPLETAV